MSANSLAAVFLIAISCGPVWAQETSVRYDVLKRLTETNAAPGKFAEAQRYLQQAVNGPSDPKLADDLVLSVNFDMRTKEYDHALATAAASPSHARRDLHVREPAGCGRSASDW